MTLKWQMLWGVTCVALVTMVASLTRGAVRRNYWDHRVSFAHSSDQTVAMGSQDCCAAGRGTVKNSFSVVLSAALTAAMISVPDIFPSVTL